MAKFRYRIEAGNYGGELTIGEVIYTAVVGCHV